MNHWLLILHLALVGLWLGCVLTEALFERALLGKGRDNELILTALNKRAFESGDDAYRVFRKMLESGHPPDDWEQLLCESESLSHAVLGINTRR